MSYQSPVNYTKTALDIQIVFISAQLSAPAILNDGNGIDRVMDIDRPDNIQYEMTTTGDVSVALLPVHVTGKIYLNPQSPAVADLAQANSNYELEDLLVPGTITVSSPSAGWSYAFSNAVITSPFGGFGVGKVVDDYTFNFKALLPNITSFTNLVNAAGNIINVI